MPHLDISEGIPFYIFLALLLVGANAFFVASEFAIVKIRSTRLEILANRGDRIARMAGKIVENLDAYLSATQLGITLASLGLGWIGEPAFAKIFSASLHFFKVSLSEATLHSISLTVAFLFISALHIILGELVPKSIAIRSAEKICLVIAVPLRIFYLVFYPFLWALNGSTNYILQFFKFPSAAGPGRAHTEEELKLIVEDSYEEGIIGPRKWRLLDKALDFAHKTVKDIMVPADKVVFFYLNDSINDNLSRAKESGHTRFPLREGRQGKIFGFIHMKDVIWGLEHGEVINLFDLCRPVIFMPVDRKIDTALKEFQSRKIHMTIVEGENGEVLGLVTLEDVIEELVGEIEDEFDKE